MSPNKTDIPSAISETDLKNFLATRKMLIVSSQPTSVKALKKLAMQLGSKPDQTRTCFSFEEAEQELSQTPISILITDLHFDKKTGIALVEAQEKNFPNRLEVASIIMCADPSNADTALMAEANVDAVFLKPFTFDLFKTAIQQALVNKVNPSPYWQQLETAKEHFKKEEFDLALSLLEASKTLDPKPVLSFYYEGLIRRKKNEFKEAITALNQGLTLDPKNYRCLTAVFEIYMVTKEFDLAYQSASKLHQTYPVSITRVLDLVKLSVYEKKYADILDYYQIFKHVESQDEQLCRVIIAGMLVCSKYFALNQKSDEALETLQSAAKIALNTGTLCLEVFRYFIETENFEEAYAYHSSLPESQRGEPVCQLLFLDLNQLTSEPASIVRLANQILSSGIQTARLYEILIQNSKKIGRSPEVLAQLTQDAQELFPNQFKKE